MPAHVDLGNIIINQLKITGEVKKEEIGTDANLSAKGISLQTESYEIPNLGHLCILRMREMMGLMKMETVVLSVTHRDVPLLNLDWMKVFGKETLVAELYDIQLEEYPYELLREYERIKGTDAHVNQSAEGLSVSSDQKKAEYDQSAKRSDHPEMKSDQSAERRDQPGMKSDQSAQYWFDEIRYPCSFKESGKGKTERFNQVASSYIQTFLSQIERAMPCNPDEKRIRNQQFAETLYAQGGPAVNQIKKLFGDDAARRLVVQYMYGGRN